MTDGATGTTGQAATGAGTGAAATAEAGAQATAGAAGTPAAFDWNTVGLDDGGKAFIAERQFKGPGDLLTSYRNLETLAGVPPERLIKLPAPRDAGDPKAWDPIYKQLGRPDTADKYVIPLPEGDKGEFATAVKPWLHEAGLSQSQATKLATKWNEHIAGAQKSQQAAMEARNVKDVSELKQAWADQYDTKAALVDRAAETFGMSQPHLDALKQTMGPKAAMEFLYNIGSKIAVEDASVPGVGQQTGFGMTPEAAQAKIKELRSDKTFVQLFSSPDLKQRREARDEMDRLHKIAYPGQSAIAGSAGSASSR
jgi:hypothetical protein